MTLVFSFPPQVLLIIGKRTMPIDYSTFIVYIVFVLMEIFTSFFVMNRIIKRKAAVYFIQNTATESNISNASKMKTSQEIIEEVNMILGEE